MTQRADILAAANDLVGIKFLHQGRSEQYGLDCAGVLYRIALRLGIKVVDSKRYKLCGDSKVLTECLEGSGFTRKKFDQALPGDVLAFWLRKNHRPVHLGIMAEAGEVIHATAEYGRVVKEPLTEDKQAQCLGAWEWPGGIE